MPKRKPKSFNHKPIVLVDFDGVLHSYLSGWKGATNPVDPPVDGAIEWLDFMVKTGLFDIQIYSARSRHEGAVEALMKWLFKYGLSAAVIDEIKFPTQKPAAFITIDDRVFHFKGTFPTVDELVNFKPWYIEAYGLKES